MHMPAVRTFTLGIVLSPILASAAVLEVPSQFATIQQAVNAAGAGDVVRVGPGVYQERVRIAGGRVGLTIEAADPANPPTIAGKPNTSNDGIRVAGVSGVVLRELRIQGANDCVRLDHVRGARLEGLELVACRLAVRLSKGSGNTIAGARILGTRGAQGILVDRAAATEVADTVITGPQREGIAARNAPGLVVLRTVVTSSHGADGIRVASSDSPRLEDSRFDGNHHDGLHVSDSAGLVLLNSTANGNESVGFRIELSPPYASVADVLATGNTAAGNGTADVRVVPKKCNTSTCPPPPTLPTTSTTSTTTAPAVTTTTTTAPPVPEVLASWRMYVRIADAQNRELNVDAPRTGDAPIDVAIPADLVSDFRVNDQVSDNELSDFGGPDLVARFADAAAAWLAGQSERYPGAHLVAIVWVKRTS